MPNKCKERNDMKAIILAAGYATRLYPLTEVTAKPLLKVGEKTLLDYVYDEIEEIEAVDQVYIISNHKFYHQFENWKEMKRARKSITIIDDGTNNVDERLGAIGDIKLVIDKENIKDELLITAGDILFDFKLKDFYNYYMSHKKDCICVEELEDMNMLRRMGVALLDEKDKVVDFEEKPQNPKSNIGVTAFYIYNKATIEFIDEYLKQGGNPDAPGHFVAWLHKKIDVYGYRFKGQCYDIGTHESYAMAQQIFKKN